MEQSQQSQKQQLKINDIENQLTDLQDKLDFQQARYEKNARDYADNIRALKNEVKAKEDSLKDLKAKIQVANSNIKEREAYLTSQEETIAEVMDRANKKLLDIRDEVSYHEENLKDYKKEIVVANQALTDIQYASTVEINTTKQEIEDLNNEKNSLLVSITEAREKLKKLDEDYAAKMEALDQKLKKIKEKEISVNVKYETVLNEKADLEIEKRRFKAEKTLYEM